MNAQAADVRLHRRRLGRGRRRRRRAAGPGRPQRAAAGGRRRYKNLQGGGPVGPDRLPEDYEVPTFHPMSTENEALSWDFFVRHYEDQKQQKRDPKFVKSENGIFYPRAGTLGGCTAHNAMIMVYPHNADWDHIAEHHRRPVVGRPQHAALFPAPGKLPPSLALSAALPPDWLESDQTRFLRLAVGREGHPAGRADRSRPGQDHQSTRRGRVSGSWPTCGAASLGSSRRRAIRTIGGW